MKPRARSCKKIENWEIWRRKIRCSNPERNKSKQYYEHGERFIVHSIAENFMRACETDAETCAHKLLGKVDTVLLYILMCSLQTAACNARSSHARRAHATSIHITECIVAYYYLDSPMGTDRFHFDFGIACGGTEKVLCSVCTRHRTFGKWDNHILRAMSDFIVKDVRASNQLRFKFSERKIEKQKQYLAVIRSTGQMNHTCVWTLNAVIWLRAHIEIRKWMSASVSRVHRASFIVIRIQTHFVLRIFVLLNVIVERSSYFLLIFHFPSDS